MNKKHIYICDSIKPTKTVFTDEGFLKTEAIVTKAGVFAYQLSDSETIRMLKHPDDIFAPAFLDSLKLIPITNDHPPVNENGQRLVTAKTAKSLSVGSSGENVKVDKPVVRVPLSVTDSGAVASIKNGKRQLSVGFLADIVQENGFYDGAPYDVRQTNIRANHIALCDAARVGSDASILLDSSEADAVFIDNNKEDKNMSETKMAQVMVDGISYEAAPEVTNALTKKDKKIEGLDSVIAENKTLIDSLKGEKDALTKTVEDLKAKDFSDDIATEVQSRLDLLDQAKDLVDAKVLTEIKAMSLVDAKRAIIKHLDAEIVLDGKSDEYVSAHFDATAKYAAKTNMATNRASTTAAIGDSAAKESGAEAFMDHLGNQWRSK